MPSKLIFKIGEESVPTKLNYESYTSSPFATQLDRGLELLDETIDRWKIKSKSAAEISKDSEEFSFSEAVDNNIIAFLGERGSGKTSCLVSMREIFMGSERHEKQQTDFLPIIDPSFFDENHNILEVLLGELYHKYQVLREKWELMSKEERQNLRELQGLFSQVKKSIKFLTLKKSELPEEHEALAALSEVVNLKALMSSLVQAFLICRKKQFLVISIDDIDLNIREAYIMMEQIRKYLVIPNVVVMMAAKFNQLRNSVTLNLSEYYRHIMPNVLDTHDIQTMADRYLDKFVPLERRIFMPQLFDYSSSLLDIVGREEEGPHPDESLDTVEFNVLSLIYKKCGYLFYNYEETPSLIIPTTLRELRSFVTTLYEMPDRDNSKECHERNKNSFKEYFFYQWTKRLLPDQQKIVRSILSENDVTKLNKTVISLVSEYANSLRNSPEHVSGENITGEKNTRVRLMEIVNPANYSENLSIGDVALVLNDLRSLADSSVLRPLIFFLNSFYSIRLYELYDQMSSPLNEKKTFGDLKNEVNRPNFPKLKSTIEYNIPDYFKLVGNGFFSLSGDSFMPLVTRRKRPTEITMMNGSLLQELINGIVHDFYLDSKIVDNREFVLRLNIAEFFVVCSSRNQDSDIGSFSPFKRSDWRSSSSDFYFVPFDSGKENIVFDVTAPFVNLISPKLAYRRFGERFFKVASVTRDSLYNKFHRNTGWRYEEYEHDMMSRMAIRNMEVLNDFSLWLQNKKSCIVTGDTDDLTPLSNFYKNINGREGGNSGYLVNTYELNEGKNDFHKISFAPLGVLAQFLDSLLDVSKASSAPKASETNDSTEEVDNKRYVSIFKNIYRKESILVTGRVYILSELIGILRDSKEEDIPEKDKVISDIMTDQNQILSDILVEYLADTKVSEKLLFYEILDEALFEKYRDFVRRKLLEKREDLRQQIFGYDNDLKMIEADGRALDLEIAKLEERIQQLTKEAEKNGRLIKSLMDEKSQLNIDLQEASDSLAEITLKYKESEKAFETASEELLKVSDSQKEAEKNLDSANKKNEENLKKGILNIDLGIKIQDLQKEIESIKSLLSSATREYEKKEKEKRELEMNERGLRHRIILLQNRLSGISSEIETQKEVGEKNGPALSSLREDMSLCRRSRMDFTNRAAKVRRGLKQCRREESEAKMRLEEIERIFAEKTR